MPSASSLFFLFSILENLLLEIFSELDEILRRMFIRQREDLDQRGPGGATQGRTPAATPPGLVARTRPWSWWVPSAPLDAYKLLFALKTKGR